ncbi:nickel-dependent hydrogenase large subunit [Pseudothauera rhizosphaerae]|uniref:Nickel-dependent hydrogenase n=1 Tax=Pseudothauera rhizosphaerae TaxID=2565932 RepID=A0A4S4B113_9RHOO|nr:nickel-dependent hydrogenase large subunit [Pseudothauera rhizosphaerae]THF65334.1 hypothetical protein E6O51_01660 [Pseudothauera rhizosphaerae]
MNPAGELLIAAEWDGLGVTRAAARNSRPHAAKLLIGRSVDEALALVPALFTLCGKAQGLTARAAVAAARAEPAPDEPARIAAERAIAAEAAQEHLWRLLLDWPALFDHEPRRARFAELYRRLASAGSGGAETAREVGGQLLDLVAAELLSGFFTVAREPSSLAEFASRARRGGTVGAALADLLEMGTHSPPQGMAALLPGADAATWAAELGGVPDEAYCRAPTWQGAPAETGALARHHGSMLVKLLIDRGHPVAARLFAEVVDLSDWASRLRHPLANDMPPVLDAAPLGEAAGLARCETARGVLIHAVCLEGDTIADYAIVAPTEWNFHPAGSFAREGSGWQAPDPETARRHLTALVLGLNPCVPFQVNLAEAGHA